MQTKRYSTVRVLRDVEVDHSTFPDAPRRIALREGWTIGNVFGHWRGVEVRDHGDGAVTLTLRADFVEVWERVPLAALELGLEQLPPA